MRWLTLLGCLSVPAAAVAFGPRENPDDQYRRFSQATDLCYADIVAGGFNALSFNYYGLWDFRTNGLDPKALAARRRDMDRVDADGLNFFEGQVMLPRQGFREAHPRLGRDGTPYPNNPDIACPEAFAKGLDMVCRALASVSNHPAFVGYAPTDEVRDGMRASFRPSFLQACRAATGADVPAWADLGVGPHFSKIPDFPVVSRVIEDDDPALRYFDWLWRKGDGWNDFNDACVGQIRKILGDRVLTQYEPAVRTPPVRGAGGAVDLLDHWAYPYPEPYNVRYLLAQEKAMGRGRPGILLGSSIQGISYRSALAPKGVTVANPPDWLAAHPDVTYLTTPPDLLREALWASFMPRSDMVGTFATWAFFDVPARGGKNAQGYAFTNPDAFGAVSNVMHEVAIPLGPLFRAVPDRPSEVAVLESRASAYFTGRILGGWGNVQRYGVMVDAAHLQPDVLFEEDLSESGVPPQVKVVIAPYCEVLTRSAYEALRGFQARGGVIAADGNLPPGLLQDVDFPMTWWTKSKGEKALAELRKGAAKLKRDLADVVTPPADSDNDCIITFVRSVGSADYVFALNDKRTFGDYVGQWGLVPEKGAPNAGTVSLPRTAGAVYDLVRHCQVPFRCAGGRTEIPVSYETSDGRLFLVVDRPLSALTVTVSGGRLTVTSPDRDVMIPVGVFADDAKPRYGVIRNGTYECPAPKSSSVTVRNLATGWVRFFVFAGEQK